MSTSHSRWEKLPQSTNSWHCPWFKAIFALCALGIVFGVAVGIVIGGTVGFVNFAFALLGAAILGREISAREHRVPSC